MKNVVLLGSTGSIGTSTCKVAEDLHDRIRLVGLAAGRNDQLLAEQTRQFNPSAISITDESKAAAMTRWSCQFAHAENQPITILFAPCLR